MAAAAFEDTSTLGPTTGAGPAPIENAGVLGWFDASRPPEYWWGPPDTGDTDNDGWVNPHVQKWAEAIRAADSQFNYGAFDSDPLDGALRPNELGVLVVIPQNGPFGTNRGVVGRESPNPMPLVVDGTTISTVAEAISERRRTSGSSPTSSA